MSSICFAKAKTDIMHMNTSSFTQDVFVTKLYSLAGPHVNLADRLMVLLQVSRQEVIEKLNGDNFFSMEEMKVIKQGFNNSALGVIDLA